MLGLAAAYGLGVRQGQRRRSTSDRSVVPAAYGAAVDDVRFDIAPAPLGGVRRTGGRARRARAGRAGPRAPRAGDPQAAAAFLAAAEAHDPSAFAGMDEATALILRPRRARLGDRRARRLRLRRRQRHRDPRAHAARPRRRGVVVPAEPLRGRLRPRGGDGRRLAAEGAALLVTADCGITVGRGGRARARTRASTSSSPTITSRAPTARLPDALIVHPQVLRLPVRGPVRGRGRLQAVRGAPGGRRPGSRDRRPRPRRRRPRHDRRLRAAARREPPARPRRPAGAVARPVARACGRSCA